MFLDNHTHYPAKLARGHLTDEHAVVSVNLELRLSLAEDGHLELGSQPPRRDTDPPDIGKRPLWRETSVTAIGTVFGPSQAPYQRTVEIAVGQVKHQLLVFGPRHWRPGANGTLRPSSAEPFEKLALDWSLAFGGSYVLEPGVLPGTDLPHPGGTVSYPLNPEGTGFYPDEIAALGQPLPQVERADELVKAWNDQPRPGGLAPCPNLVALRMEPDQHDFAAKIAELSSTGSAAPGGISPADLLELMAPAPDHISRALRLAHHAPETLIVPEPVPGSRLILDGLGRQPVAFELPPSPIAVEARTGEERKPVAPRVRSVHVDADQREVLVAWGHETIYHPAAAPEWLTVLPATGGESS